jgi:hypothetical protein
LDSAKARISKKMKYTKIYSPAEALLILSEGKVSFPYLFKVTFCELINKKILNVRISEASPNNADMRYARLSLRSSIKRNSYSGKVHYLAVLKPIVKKAPREILFRIYIKIIGQSPLSKNNFVRLILQNEVTSQVIKRNIFQRLFGGITLTQEGKDIKRKLEVEVVTMKNKLATKGQSSSSLMDKLTLYGSSVLLMQMEDLWNLLKQLLQYDPQEIEPHYKEQYDEWMVNLNMLLYSKWEEVHEYTDASGHGSGGDGGYSAGLELDGDNGCSGCSGSGCSGCGGGCS